MTKSITLTLLLIASSAYAETHRVLLPNGSPAAGVEVLIAESGKPDRTLRTDAAGRFEFDQTERAFLNFSIVVDIPGAALGIWNVPTEDLELRPEFEVAGRAVLPGGKPATGAKIEIEEFGRLSFTPVHAWPKNAPWRTTKAGPKGEFSLRGAVLNSSPHPARVMLAFQYADAEEHWTLREGLPIRGTASFFKERGDEPRGENLFVLQRSGSIGGRLVDAFSRTPVAAARLTVFPNHGQRTPSTVSDHAGDFLLERIPAQSRRELEISGNGIARARLRRVASKSPSDRDVRDIVVPISRAIPVEVAVVDAHSGKPPLVPLRARFDRSIVVERKWQLAMKAPIERSGPASFRGPLPEGEVELRVFAVDEPFPAPYRQSFRHLVTPETRKLELRVERRPGVLFEISLPGNPPPSDPRWSKLRVSHGSGKRAHRISDRTWFVATDSWGDDVEITVSEWTGVGRKTVIPRRTVKADPDTWPVNL